MLTRKRREGQVREQATGLARELAAALSTATPVGAVPAWDLLRWRRSSSSTVPLARLTIRALRRCATLQVSPDLVRRAQLPGAAGELPPGPAPLSF